MLGFDDPKYTALTEGRIVGRDMRIDVAEDVLKTERAGPPSTRMAGSGDRLVGVENQRQRRSLVGRRLIYTYSAIINSKPT